MRSANKSKSNGIKEEVADFDYDLRLARRWKRRRNSYQSFKLNSSSHRAPKKTINKNNNNNNVVCKVEVVDFQLDYCSNRENNMNDNNNSHDDDDGNVGVEEDEVDVEYEMFLNGLRSYGELGCPFTGSYGDGEAEGDAWCEDNNDDDKNENGDDDNDLDPQYMMFLGKLKEDGTSYVLEVPLNVDISGFLKYETEVGSCDGHKSEDLGVTENCSMRKNTKSQRISRSVSGRKKIENLEILNDVIEKQKIESPRTLRSVSRKESMKTKKNFSDVRSRKRTSPTFEKNVKVEAASPVSCQTKKHTTKRSSPESFHSTRQECNRKMKCDMVDESYQVFLSCLKKVGKNTVYMPQSGKQVVYEEDVDSTSDTEVIVMDDDPFSGGRNTPFVTSNIYDSFTAEPGRRSQSQFRDKLMDILKKPYDYKEYKDLWEELSCRKPMEGYRELRNGRGRPCKLESAGKSYLDHDKNLVAKIKSAGRDRLKKLNLLRGYIYWLQNLANDGSFYPWMDSLCLEVLPQV